MSSAGSGSDLSSLVVKSIRALDKGKIASHLCYLKIYGELLNFSKVLVSTSEKKLIIHTP